MTKHSISIKKTIIFSSLFVFTFLGIYFLTGTSSVSAQNSGNPCLLKINKDKCEQEIKDECKSSTPDGQDRCAKGKAKKYTSVFKECRTKAQPQSCHNKAKEKCKGKTGKARTECRKKETKDLKEGDPAAEDDFTQFGPTPETNDTCGEGEKEVNTRFDFGCTGTGNPIQDVAYALVRFLSVGVAIVIVASIVYAGIQYSSSEGSPDAAAAAKKRIQNAVAGLVFYMFIFALIQYLVPGGLFAP